ncbi:MAG: hypothetical protein IKW98_03655 [Prevotella sp.]|nr:hypothetical protein [Prevotella sp.]
MDQSNPTQLRCSECGFPVPPKHDYCPHCGRPLTENTENKEVSQEQKLEEGKGEGIIDEALNAELEKQEMEFDFDLELQRKAFDADLDRQKKEFDFDLVQHSKNADDERTKSMDEHGQAMADRESLRKRDNQQFDFDLELQRKAFEADLDRQKKEFDFDQEQRSKNADHERTKSMDEHGQAMADRESLRKRDNQQFDLDLELQRKAFEADLDRQKKEYDFDQVQNDKNAEFERELKKANHMQDLADREAQRRMEELQLKGSIAMQNMEKMLAAKRAARQDEMQHEKETLQSKFEAEERRMQTQKEMTAEQIMAAQIREMDAGAQAKFAESFSASKNAEREREMADEKAQMYERMMQQMQTGNQQNAQMQQQMMQQMMEMVKMGFQANANVATGRIDALRDNIRPSSPVTSEPSPIPTPAPEPPKPLRLNTLWLRKHGYEGSFNELAGQLANLGGDISQDFDEQGNPVIVVDNLPNAKIMDVLINMGIIF